ncbi:Prefoldin [Microstroma glucosiphilum]|uniref:Prefoldin n=1 Tax=Pseudomicrostroma glucosiphilum TaxID=1684307 RepID=A0A316UE87_9BASI|nr:Prefoldin [Pseudomicrostroma glucosiphilum]PWN22691.1 Prefoldin [Pseudomicrostroma glucosiphilum]
MTSVQTQPNTGGGAGAGPSSGRNPAALAQEYQSRRQELQGLAQKMGELEADADEHLLVIKTLKETDQERKCFRLVGGVLLEKTVKDVVPTLETSVQGLKQVMDTLMKQYKQREEELMAFQKEHGAS